MGSSLEPRTTKIPAYQNSDFITDPEVCTAAVTTLLCRTARDICILPSAAHNKREPMNCTAPCSTPWPFYRVASGALESTYKFHNIL